MEKIRILQLTTSLQENGPGKRLLALFKYLDQDRFRISACSMYQAADSIVRQLPKLNIDYTCLNMKNFFDIRVLNPLLKLLKDKKIDILHTHNIRADYYGRIAAKVAGTKLILSTVGGEYTSYYRINYNFGVYSLTKFTDHLMDRWCCHYIAVSERIREIILNDWGVNPSKVSVIYNGIDLTEFDEMTDQQETKLKERLGENNYKIIGTVMVFKKSKGYEYLVGAAQKLVYKYPNMKFLCVGGGGDRSCIEALVRENRLDNFFLFTGHRQDVVRLLSKMDIFVFPSYSEGFPRAVLEAMAGCKPVVVSNIGGCNELVTHNVNGLIIEPRDAQGLADAINYLIQNPEFARKIAEQGKQMVEQKFNASHNAKAHEQLYLELLRRC